MIPDTIPKSLLGLIDRWVTVTHPDEPRRVWHGRLTEIWDRPSIVLEIPGGGRQQLPMAFDIKAADPNTEPRPDTGQLRTWADFRNSGMLWLVNRLAFHPRGLALAFYFEPTGEPTGWSLLTNDDGEPWQFDPATDDDGQRRAEATIAAALTRTDTVRTECPDTERRPLLADEKQLQKYPAYATHEARCSVCAGGPVAYDNYEGSLFCWRCADCDCGRAVCLRTGLHLATCNASWADAFHGRATCYLRHPAHENDIRHEGRSEDGSTLRWDDRYNGAIPHRPDSVRTPGDTCPATDAAVRAAVTLDALTSPDTARTPCPDTGDDRPDGVRFAYSARVPRRQMGAAFMEAFGLLAAAQDNARSTSGQQPTPTAQDRAEEEITVLRARVGELADTLADVLARFTIAGPAWNDAAARTDWVAIQTIEQWRRTHTGKGPANWSWPHVHGTCPACSRTGLFLGSGGYVTCSHADCTDPGAASDTLANADSLAHAQALADTYGTAYERLRADVLTAVEYISQQQSIGALHTLRHNRARVLTTLTTWIKEPDPVDALRPTAPSGGTPS